MSHSQPRWGAAAMVGYAELALAPRLAHHTGLIVSDWLWVSGGRRLGAKLVFILIRARSVPYRGQASSEVAIRRETDAECEVNVPTGRSSQPSLFRQILGLTTRSTPYRMRKAELVRQMSN